MSTFRHYLWGFGRSIIVEGVIRQKCFKVANADIVCSTQGIWGKCRDFPDLSDDGRMLLANTAISDPEDPNDEGPDSEELTSGAVVS